MYRSRMAAAVIAALCVSESVRAGEAPKWGAHLDLEGKLGTERHLGEVDLFLPVAQDDRTLLFTNIRTRMDDAGSREGNFGLGVRTMLDSGWNLGGYGYFDRRRSELDNYFNQVTLGAEALSRDWDLRANAYLPVGRTTHQEDSLNTAEVSGASVIFKGGEERSLGGFDAEIGWRLPVFDPDGAINLRAYAGGYRFADEDVPTVAGPRGRVEMVFDEVPHLWDGSRLSLGAEWQRDEPRGSQGFLTARLRIPLQAESNVSRLTPMERRMADPIVRDIDVVAQAGAYGATETVSQLANGTTFVTMNSTSTSNLVTAVTAAANNSTILLSGSFSTTATVNLTGNKSIIAGSVSVRSPSGRTATLNTSATISSSDAVQNTIQAPGNNTISGLTIIGTDTGGGASGILMNSTAGTISILNNTIRMTQTGNNGILGISGDRNANVTISGNAITVVGMAGQQATGISLLGSVGTADGTISGNTLNVSGGGNNYLVTVDATATVNTGSTGNVRVAGTCDSASNATGAVAFTDGTSCR